MDKLYVKRLFPDSVLPIRATDGSAGYDLCAHTCESIEIMPKELKKIPTGIAISISDKNIVGLLYLRSSIGAKYGVSMANGVGVIDSDYRGEICVCVINHSEKTFIVENGMRIAQLVLTPVFTPELCEADELDETARGANGFGSTGK